MLVVDQVQESVLFSVECTPDLRKRGDGHTFYVNRPTCALNIKNTGHTFVHYKNESAGFDFKYEKNESILSEIFNEKRPYIHSRHLRLSPPARS